MKKDINDTIFTINGHKVEIKKPVAEEIGEMLILPGWGFSRTKWCEETQLCSLALAAGYRLVLPETFKSIYHSSVFRETRSDWKENPDRKWVIERMIPELQKHGIFSGKENYVIGLSTGARGVALICLDMPGFFKAAGALSGDYDQTRMKDDNLMKGYYGPYEKFPERWDGVDNPFARAGEWKTPLYIAHGLDDKVVPAEQSIVFAERLKQLHPDQQIITHFPHAGHDFKFWGSEVERVLRFFQEHQ